jgi:hypothetical protein
MSKKITFEEELIEILPNAISEAKRTVKKTGEYIWRGPIGDEENNIKKIIIVLKDKRITKISIEERKWHKE